MGRQAGASKGGFIGGGVVPSSIAMQKAERSGAELVIASRVEPKAQDAAEPQ